MATAPRPDFEIAIPINNRVLQAPNRPGIRGPEMVSFRISIEVQLSERTIKTLLYVAVLLIRWYFGH